MGWKIVKRVEFIRVPINEEADPISIPVGRVVNRFIEGEHGGPPSISVEFTSRRVELE